MQWNYRQYGSVVDPVHKSHLIKLTGDYGCPREFQYSRTQAPRTDDNITSARSALGTATHEVIATLLSHPRASGSANERSIREQLDEWLRIQEPLRWKYDDDRNEMVGERVAMVLGLLRFVDRYVARVIACESAFIAPFSGYWLSGHIDLIYEPTKAPSGPNRSIALADWKTGAQKPHPIELEHGWEGGVYSAALRHGLFVERNHMSRDDIESMLIRRAQSEPAFAPTYGVFPSCAYQVHLADWVPYSRAGKKLVSRVEDMLHFGYREPTQHSYKASEMRGGAWMPVTLHELDLPRLAHRLRNVVSTVRLGRFIDRPGERCTRCSFARDCLNDGYQQQATPDLIAIARMGLEDETL